MSQSRVMSASPCARRLDDGSRRTTGCCAGSAIRGGEACHESLFRRPLRIRSSVARFCAVALLRGAPPVNFDGLWDALLAVGRDPATGGYRRFPWAGGGPGGRARFARAGAERGLHVENDG